MHLRVEGAEVLINIKCRNEKVTTEDEAKKEPSELDALSAELDALADGKRIQR